MTKTRVRVEDHLAIPEDGPPWLAYIDGEDGDRDGVVYASGAVRSSALPGFAISIEELFTGADDDWAPPAPRG